MFARPVGVALMLVATTLMLGVPSPAGATDGETVVFTSTGSEQQYVVPSGIWSLKVHLVGGSGDCTIGAMVKDRGDDVTTTRPVTPGQVFYVMVAGNASGIEGGYNGGGDAANPSATGGGGASDLRSLPLSDEFSLSSRMVVAGGGVGGGEANFCSGPLGGINDGTMGDPGTESAGGAGGTSNPACVDASSGSLGLGGNGAPSSADPSCYAGGGGGGGIYGGGGGGAGSTAGAAGGRGSSGDLYDASAVITTDTTGVPKIEITPVLAPVAHVSAEDDGYFATQTIGTTSPAQVVTVTNAGAESLTIFGISYDGAQASDFLTASTTCGASLAVAASCEIQVAFAPKGIGGRRAGLVLATDDGYSHSLPLWGTGVSNQFSFVDLIRNKTQGTARLVVKIPGPGLLKLTGLRVKTQRKTATGPKVRLAVVPKDGLRTKLERAGEVRIKVTVTYRPQDGVARSKSRWVKLVLN